MVDKLKIYREKKIYKYSLYTLFFWCTAGYLIYRAFECDHFAVGGSDAFTQMYPAMLYIGRVYREFFQSILSGAEFTFPMIEWSLGMGENTISTLNYYGLGDPFYIFAALFSEEQMPYFYTALFYLRIYLGGIVCIAFFEELDEGKSNFAYIVGVLVYVFSGFTLQSNIFIIFVHAIMYTPMMFWGAERVLKHKRSGVLALSVCLYALSGFFFLYVCSLALAVYVICRVIDVKYDIRNVVKYILILIREYMIGLAASAIIFVPAVEGFLSSNRANMFELIWKFIPLKEMKQLVINMVFPQYSNTQTMSVAGMAMLCVLLALVNRSRNKQKIGIILSFLCMIIPAITTIMSGFGGYYDRWQIVLILYFAYITFIMWDDLPDISTIQRGVLFAGLVIIGLYSVKFDKFDDYILCYTVLGTGTIIIFLVFIFPMCRKMQRFTCMKLIFSMIVVYLVCKGWIMVARDMEINLVREENVVQELTQEDTDTFYRVDYEKTFGEPRLGMNLSLMLDFPGISEYFSIENQNYMNAFGSWETGKITHNNEGLDQRAILETMFAVKYYVGRTENEFLTPYGFEKVKTSKDGEWNLYHNKYALPVIYTYNYVYKKEAYMAMSGLEKQQVLLQAAVPENYNGSIDVLPKIDNNLKEAKYKIVDISNGTIADNIIHIQQGTMIELLADIPDDCESYLSIDGDTELNVDLGNGYIKYKEPITLGTTWGEGARKLTLTFRREMDLPVEYIRVLYYDFSDYSKYISKLNDGTSYNIQVSTNTITCQTNSTENRILCLAVPYEKGWSAYIDGKKCTIYRTNSMFMGIEIPQGTHSVEFRYATPGLRIGACITGIVLIGLIIYSMRKIYRRK